MILLTLMLVLMLLPVAKAETQAAIRNEYKGVWFSYYDYQKYLKKYPSNTAAKFTKYFDGVLLNCRNKGFNTIIVQVRPFGDAIYSSSYFPTSAYIAKKQGAAISYDPLKIMVSEAHRYGLRIEAWINPYRVSAGTSYTSLAANNPAKIWHNSSDAGERRNVLAYGGKLYYNPSKSEVRKLIVNGVKEIVKNYDVDGIHMDDYFYPTFSAKNYTTAFDAAEYNASKEKKQGMAIEDYRRKQVSTLVSDIYSAIKDIDKSCTCGISPAGSIGNLTSKYSYYVDIRKWCSTTGYVDYIAPQIYWGFYHKTAKFNIMVNQWLSITDRSKVKLYIGLPVYKMGSKAAGTTKKEKKEFVSKTLLSKMVVYGRKVGVNGFIAFDYSDLVRAKIKTAVKKMSTQLKK